MTMLARSKPLENGEADRRDERGRFVYAPGPGRPRRAVEQDYLAAFSGACTPQRLAGIVQNVAVAAERGDQSAIQILLRYLVGNPSAAPTLTQMAIAEMADADPVEREAKKLKFQALTEQYLDAVDL
jgi:hypothetical protein